MIKSYWVQSIVNLTKEDKSKGNPHIMKNLTGNLQQRKSGEVPYLAPVNVLSIFLFLLLNIKTYLVSLNYPE